MVLLSLTTVALAGDPSTPHPHPAVLSRATTKPAGLELTADELERLSRDEPVVRSWREDGGGTGVAVREVQAPATVVWDVILDYDRYVERVGTVKACEVYSREDGVLHVDMQSSILGIKNVLYTRNWVHQDDGWMAWSLDRERTSDVGDLVGYWRVEQVSADPPRTRLETATQLRVSGVPGFVTKYLARQSLIDGTGWVKAVSEELVR